VTLCTAKAQLTNESNQGKKEGLSRGPFLFRGDDYGKFYSSSHLEQVQFAQHCGFLACFAMVIWMVVASAQKGQFLTPPTGWLTIGATLFLIVASIEPVLGVARTGYAGVKEVCVATAVLVARFSVRFILFSSVLRLVFLRRRHLPPGVLSKKY
jgi:hypothetical protein